jgi:hypothetical protein
MITGLYFTCPFARKSLAWFLEKFEEKHEMAWKGAKNVRGGEWVKKVSGHNYG